MISIKNIKHTELVEVLVSSIILRKIKCFSKVTNELAMVVLSFQILASDWKITPLNNSIDKRIVSNSLTHI
jgi:hypothetical protein